MNRDIYYLRMKIKNRIEGISKNRTEYEINNNFWVERGYKVIEKDNQIIVKGVNDFILNKNGEIVKTHKKEHSNYLNISNNLKKLKICFFIMDIKKYIPITYKKK